ncbi:MspA family porin [Nocardia alni]|uniref:MspA family porin n=1 Tax=Nocardia alni TaxID=2815723 RepID=UPI001C246A02|nr:MspA family porin [Nocardia alni]
MNIRKSLTRAAGIGVVATAALGLFSTGAANADTFVGLPGGNVTQTFSDGTQVHGWLDGESANINPSLGSTPVHRNAWVSGTAHVHLTGNASVNGGNIYPGYVVGCQVNISGANASGSPSVGGSWDSSGNVTPSAGVGTSGNLTLGPGQAQAFYILDTEKADDFGNDIHKTYTAFTGNDASVAWSDETIGLTGCGGYAQARSFVSYEISDDHIQGWVTLWGKPFSIG